MRVPVRTRVSGVRFNITPLIDVVFNLVIFFLVASHFARIEPAESVALPSATQTQADPSPRRLTVTIQSDGTYVVNGQPASDDDLRRMIREGAGDAPENYAVRVRGDKSAPYRFVEPIMLECARQGVKTFGFNVVGE